MGSEKNWCITSRTFSFFLTERLNSIFCSLFINFFSAPESHCNRSQSKCKYLDSSLNIAKMFSMYNKTVDASLKVSKIVFRKIFSNNFHIGFSSPASDVSLKLRLILRKKSNLWQVFEFISLELMHFRRQWKIDQKTHWH